MWHKIINNTHHNIKHEIPDLITGDFDSANMDNVQYFKSQGSEVIGTLDQDRTDFTKCLEEISLRMSKISPTIADDAQSDAQDNNLDQNGSRSNESDAQDDVDVVKMSERPAGVRLVYAFVENSGRLDQIMANLQSLFLAPGSLGDVYLLSSESVSWLLPPGSHHISLPQTQLTGLHCGLIPLAGTTTITSKGLKWDLDEGQLKFGSLVSTSNAFLSNDVHIKTDNHLLFTMDIIKSIS